MTPGGTPISPRTEPRPAKPGRSSHRWFLAIGSIVVALVLAELTLTVLGIPPAVRSFRFLGNILTSDTKYVPDDDVFWKLDPTSRRSNWLGLRGWAPYRAEKPSQVLRIVCIGDSCTYGAGVRYEEAYGMVLDRRLREAVPNRAVETILAGIPGYSSHQNRVMYERDIAQLRADVTVLYCGAWNDYQLAVGATDREKATQYRGLRIARFFRDNTAHVTEEEKKRYVEEFRAGRAPDGRRVSLDEFRENFLAIVDRAQAGGSLVIVIIPTCDEQTWRDTPIAAEYQAVVRQIVAKRRLQSVDEATAFSAVRHRVKPDWLEEFGVQWPCFLDFVHPSVLGHRVLADELFAILEREGIVMNRALAVSAPTISGVDAEVNQGAILAIRGTGFESAGSPLRVFVGPWWISDVEVVDDTTLHVRAPQGVRPGVYRVSVVGSFGTCVSSDQIELRAPRLRVTTEIVDGRMRLVFESSGPPNWRAGVWFSLARRSKPADTRHGQFGLAAEPDGRPPSTEWAPFDFLRLTLLEVGGQIDETGRWHLETWIEKEVVESLPDVVYCQGSVIEPGETGRAALTDVVPVQVL